MVATWLDHRLTIRDKYIIAMFYEETVIATRVISVGPLLLYIKPSVLTLTTATIARTVPSLINTQKYFSAIKLERNLTHFQPLNLVFYVHLKKVDNGIRKLINLFPPPNPHRSTPKMPANKKNQDPRVRAYDPIQEAQIPTSNLTWERQAVNVPRRTTKPSSTFKIPRTLRQEPSTMMPNPPYEALNLTYASSSKTRPRAAVGNKRRADSEKTRDAEAKKPHFEWLHSRAIPDMDREIMKTNVLVDNILTEQTELDTQMLAIRAMGGEEAYNNAYKAHDGLRRAIAKRLLDTKRKRAKQFETIRSMRTMLRTLVAEIGDNADNRQHILRSRYSSLGSSNTSVTAMYTMLTNLKFNPYITAGPNPRSLLRPKINRDNNLKVLPSAPPPHRFVLLTSDAAFHSPSGKVGTANYILSGKK